jgi:hypothetical protein
MGYDAARIRTSEELGELARRLTGRFADLRAVALDDQNAKLHIPLVERVPDRHPRPRRTVRMRPAGKLVVRRVTDLIIETDGRMRWLALDGLAWDPHRSRLTVVEVDGLRLIVDVEELDVSRRPATVTAAGVSTGR